MDNKKKIAMLIIDAMGRSGSSDKPEYKKPDGYAKKKDDDGESKGYESTMGCESAMDEFIEAVAAKDSKKASKALMEFNEMSTGTEYMGSESKED